jgi:ribosomal protein S18 acetylase RimI-like enzyme
VQEGIKLIERIRFKRVNEEDEEKINKLTESTWGWGDYNPKIFDRWVREGLFIKAVDEYDNILGMIHVRLFEDFAWLEGVRVKQEIRRKGIGKLLARNAMDLSNKRVFRLVANEKNVPSIQLARSLGFREIDEFNFISFGMEASYDQIVKELDLHEVNDDLNLSGYVDDWVWFPIEKYKKKKYGNEKIILLETNPPFLAKGYVEGYKQISKDFSINSERYIVYELKI